MDFDEMFPIAVAQEMLQDRIADTDIVWHIGVFYVLSHVDAVAALSAARILEQRARDTTPNTSP